MNERDETRLRDMLDALSERTIGCKPIASGSGFNERLQTLKGFASDPLRPRNFRRFPP
jgi:hypothetical protein